MSTFKHLALYSLLLIGIAPEIRAQKSKNNFVLEGTCKDMTSPPDRLYVTYDTILHRPDDTVSVKDGKYTLKGSIDEPTQVKIKRDFLNAEGQRSFSMTTDDMIDLFLSKGTMQVTSTGHMSNAVITGSPANDDYRQANKRLELWGDTIRRMYKMALETKNDALARSVISPQTMAKMSTIMEEEWSAFVRNHPESGASLYLVRSLTDLKEIAGWTDTVVALYQLLPATVRSGPQGRIVGARLMADQKTAIGHQAMNFTQNDTAGRPVSLSSFKGKYVLLDFWASWDDNAAKALPVLSKAGELYGSKGLVVLGVSLDADKDSWLQMIREANAGSITHVSDLKGKGNSAAKLYGITALPKNLLIDPNGIIVAKNLTSMTLDKTLSSIFE